MKKAVSKITAGTRRESNYKTERSTMKEQIEQALIENACVYPEKIKSMTARQIAEYMHKNGIIVYPARAIIQPRLTELVKEGKLKIVGKEYDSITDRDVASYAILETALDKQQIELFEDILIEKMFEDIKEEE